MRMRFGRRTAAGVLAALAGFAAPAARAALSCEQMFAIAERTVELRDHGASLQQVLAELKSREVAEKLSAEEVQVLRKTVSAVYLGNATAAEVALACKEAAPKK
jgi:hypothetical protein